MSEDLRFDRNIEHGYRKRSPQQYFDSIEKYLKQRQLLSESYSVVSDDLKDGLKEDINYINERIKLSIF